MPVVNAGGCNCSLAGWSGKGLDWLPLGSCGSGIAPSLGFGRPF